MTIREPKKNEHLGIRFSEEVLHQIKAIAARQDLGSSEWVRDLVMAELEKWKEEHRALSSIFGDIDK